MSSYTSSGRDGIYGRLFPYPTDRTIVTLFEAQASALPAQPALTFGDAVITYSELNTRASQVACVLAEHGVGKGDFVPLVMGGGLELPIAMIAAMKIAAPFVPIDSAWPKERVHTIIGQLQPKLMITGHPGRPYLPRKIQCLQLNLNRWPLPSRECPYSYPGVDDLIYGFFTSGSTGIPKCALNRHRGLLNRFLYMTKEFSSEGQIVLQNSHHVFDSSIWQLLWPLTIGGQVIIPDRSGTFDLERTLEIIARHQVTMTDFVPSIFNIMTGMLSADPRLAAHLTSLRRILIGGEEVNGEAVRTLRGLLPKIRITNTYGPTEASIGSIFHEITDADGDRVPLGRPIDNTYAVVLNGSRAPAQPGEIGEIHIGGDCLGAGYLNDAAKTAAAFVPNPLPEIPGSLLYRTGDLGHQRADGLFIFAGRADDQVKLGGVRIQLAEVELALLTHRAVRQAKVIIHGDTLIGFVAADAGVTAAALMEHARALLPASSVPRRIVVQDALPLSPNGKIDRQELVRRSRRVTSASQGALGEAEQALKEIWLKLLACDDVATTQSFFDVGGDSLAAQRLAVALRHHFGVHVTVRDIGRTPTIQAQARVITGEQPGSAAATRDEIDILHRDIWLPESIERPGAGPSGGTPARFLLTGATGFLGAHLLRELAAQRVDARVYCLVRADSRASARARLVDTLAQYNLPVSALCNVIAVPGDLSRPRFGLDHADFARLADSVDAVVHNGALVNLIMDYPSHRLANVSGTAEVVRLAALGLRKRIHYVSTLGVFPPPTCGESPIGEHEPWQWLPPHDGYSQSKWVAEKILALARTRGIPSTVYRMGEVMPHSRGGPANPRSVLGRLLHACLRTGLWFKTPAVTDWTPVDTVSQFIAATAVTGRARDDCFHVLLPYRVPVASVMATLAASRPMSEVAYPQFWARLSQIAQGGDDPELRKLLSVLPDPQAGPAPELLTGVFSDATAEFETTCASRMARELGLPWPSEFDGDTVAAFCRTVLAANPATCHGLAQLPSR